ncbi:MAG: phosphate ABC transporter permease family protein, partial [Pseudomonadota bacterium]
MTIFTLLTLVALIATASFLMGRQLAVIRAEGAYTELHSLPSYHGLFALIWCAVPALLVFALWSTLQPVYLQSVAFAYFPQDVLDGPESGLRMSTVELVANGFEKLDARSQDQIVYGLSELRAEMAKINQPLPGVVPSYVLEAAREVVDQRAGLSFWRVIVVMAVAVGGAAMGLSQISKGLRARNLVEAFVRLLLFAGSAIAILTTIGIVWALVSETLAFFRLVPPSEFFFGLTWNPGFEFGGEAGQSSGEFGILPLLWGTAYISLIALLIAVPVGLMAAVYMSEFASNRVRSIGKPLLEILAGIPTVVYGYFA